MLMDKDKLTDLMDELNAVLSKKATTARLYIAGGAAMALAYDDDRVTRDIDASIEYGYGAVMPAAHEIARSHGLPSTWLNEQATPYMPPLKDRHGVTVYEGTNLVVIAASAEHMLAMKIRSARKPDTRDMPALLGETGIGNVSEATELFESVFPQEQLNSRQMKWLEHRITDANKSAQT